jgi:AI-2 transport protein TqsA
MRFLMIAATLVIILWGINQAQAVVVLFLVSGFLAAVATVPVHWLERKRVPPTVAVMIVVAAMVAVLLSMGAVVGASLNEFSSTLPQYHTRIHDMLYGLKAHLAEKGLAITDAVLFGYANPSAVMDFTTALFTAFSSVLSNLLLIFLTVVFILLEAGTFPAKLRSILKTPRAGFPRVTEFVEELKRYLVMKTLFNLIAGTLTTIWLLFLGVDFPILWGFLAFLLHYVPNIGLVIAAVPAVLLALVQFGWGSAALTASGYLVIGTVCGNILEPRVMGRSLGLSTLVVFVSVVLWGYLLGVIGALLCVPLTMTLKIACEANEETRWIGVVLGPVAHKVSPVASRRDR